MRPWLDGSLYPDVPVPAELRSLEDRADFIARLCSAWDFGVLPRAETVDEIRKPDWRAAVDACRLLTSPAYHRLRRWHGLPEEPYLGARIAAIADDPSLAHV